MGGRKWSEQEERDLYICIHIKTISETALFLGRSEAGVKGKLLQLGLAIRKVRKYKARPKPNAWTKEEVSYLKRAAGKRTSHEIAAHLSRTVGGVKLKARKLGLSLSKTPWSLEEINTLEALREQGKTWPEIGILLKRTPSACRRKYGYIFK